MIGRRTALAGGGVALVLALACSRTSAPAAGAADGGSAAPGPTSTLPSATGGGDAAPGDGAVANADAGPRYQLVYYDINHVLGTGQSLSIGSLGTPPLSTTQPYANTMFASGPIAGGAGLTVFSPLVEIGQETHSAAFANLVTKLAREIVLVGADAGQRSHDVLVSGHGVGGIAYTGLKKGTVPYANGMAQVTAALGLARTANKSYIVRGITNVHGETDHVNGNTAYEDNLVEWQANYDTDVRAITGQTDPVPMFHTQMSSWTAFGTTTTSAIPIAQLAAHVDHPGKIILVGPKYYLDYVADGVHLTNHGYQHMGEDYAKAYRRTILEGVPWEPVRPIAIQRVGALITIKFAVPAPPLVLDETLVSNPGGYGFEFAQTGAAAPHVQSVLVTAPDTVTVGLDAEPTGTNFRIRYAFTGVPGAHGGPTTGPRGNLRDSDATVSPNGYALYNWCVHFDQPVP